MKEAWSQPTGETLMTTAQYEITMQKRLDLVATAAADNLRTAQNRQKHYYDQHSRERSLSPGDEVLLLLPSSPRKLQAAWQGPYTVTKVDKVSYELDMGPYRRKHYRTFHVNLLRALRRPQLVAFTASGLPVEDDDPDTDILLEESSPPQSDPRQPHINEELTASQQTDLAAPLETFSNTVGYAWSFCYHRACDYMQARPIRRRPYWLAQAHHATVKEAVTEMLDMGVIHPSCSPWSSPVGLVLKKDGSIRCCVDYHAFSQVSVFNTCPMPRVDEILDSRSGVLHLYTGPVQRLLADSSQQRLLRQDGVHYTLWVVRVCHNALWPTWSTHHIPELHGYHLR